MLRTRARIRNDPSYCTESVLKEGKDGFNDDVRWIRFDWCLKILVGYLVLRRNVAVPVTISLVRW